MASTLAIDLGMVLGLERIAYKSNGGTARFLLLDALYLQRHLVSIDAMGCQKEITAKVVAKAVRYRQAIFLGPQSKKG